MHRETVLFFSFKNDRGVLCEFVLMDLGFVLPLRKMKNCKTEESKLLWAVQGQRGLSHGQPKYSSFSSVQNHQGSLLQSWVTVLEEAEGSWERSPAKLWGAVVNPSVSISFMTPNHGLKHLNCGMVLGILRGRL